MSTVERLSILALVGMLAVGLAVAEETADCRTARQRVQSAEQLVAKAKEDLRRAEANLRKCEATKAKTTNYSCEGMKSALEGARKMLATQNAGLKAEQKNLARQCRK